MGPLDEFPAVLGLFSALLGLCGQSSTSAYSITGAGKGRREMYRFQPWESHSSSVSTICELDSRMEDRVLLWKQNCLGREAKEDTRPH